MPKINLSFKNDELEIYNWLEKQNSLIGLSNYFKQLLLEDMNRRSIKIKDSSNVISETSIKIDKDFFR